ncbi:hypothetical protein B0H15DRAFT_170307 [Mycena belliarum]|uniref:SRR1-like domain-containing protein n=1 Tax=Mycena belliarum TaxID=1033014 RepID=A0AAD6UBI1_9AGAR|nr:hypothetical protein B0H15DRAFT_170307 [Mycena belliae]
MPRSICHPRNPFWRVRLHPTSRLFTSTCHRHGLGCLDALSPHHLKDSWTPEDRDAHPSWMHDIVDMCATAAGSYICDDICRMFQNAHNFELGKSPLAVGAQPTISDEIAYFHGSPLWDLHWKSPATFTLHPDLIHLLSQHQTATVEKHLSKIEKYYNDMDAAGFFTQTANDFVAPVFRSADPACPPYPASAFGAGFSGFDRVDERGWDRAGYEAAADHSRDEWEWRSAHQIAYFIALGRIFEIPAGLLVAYDPCYSRVDVVLLAALGVRALCKGDPAVPQAPPPHAAPDALLRPGRRAARLHRRAPARGPNPQPRDPRRRRHVVRPAHRSLHGKLHVHSHASVCPAARRRGAVRGGELSAVGAARARRGVRGCAGSGARAGSAPDAYAGRESRARRLSTLNSKTVNF